MQIMIMSAGWVYDGWVTSELSLSLPAKSSELSLDSVCTLRAMQIATCDLCQLVLLYNM